MRFESFLWTVLAMFLIGGAGWNEGSLVGGVSGRGDYQAADGGSEIPPPIMDPGSKFPPSNVDGGSEIPPPPPRP